MLLKKVDELNTIFKRVVATFQNCISLRKL